jgi:predicted DNA-binding antitoxin AbrB/MazE fold protein
MVSVSKVIRVKYEKGVLKLLEPLELTEGEELLVKIVVAEERGRLVRRVPRIPGSSTEGASG